MTPLSFSIVTPSFNQAPFVEEALSSVSMQGWDHVEHWVIDGGSTDGTLDALRKFKRDHGNSLRWISEADRGQSDALNKGFARVSGDIVGWLNSDDRYRKGCFERVAKAFEKHPQVDLVYGDYTWMDERGEVFRIRREIEFSHFILLYHRVLYVPTTATFFRRRVLEEGAKLEEHWQYAMDYAFFLQLAARGYRFMHIPSLLADFRFQQNSKTCSAAHKQLEELEVIRRQYSPLLRRAQSRRWRRLLTAFLGSCAGAMRYSEKLARGYYLDQFRVSSLNS